MGSGVRCVVCDESLDETEVECPVCGEPVVSDGDVRSGPEGYSPNTAYPESWYGGFDEGDLR